MSGEPTDKIGYATALEELQDILSELEAESVDVDILATRVERADGLIRLCRDRLEAARLKVEQVVDALDDA
ncbi:MAG: exodeoxyribonuclease VII small subunit [Acidimicrobiales bacterium]|jgi:exodeoxyribonuclease VII small subunit|nr:exodeoxyribonuclease VII small subunit [Actinomycetota bacterium]MDP6281084.1 exodeoxyribonuclease VII small subunit [Acidimicrobiales bacterium]MDP7116929.1 exodeoxyribonuclease VII small subunit [Acidimicrobiales bacterium]MDP7411261.1 exodeoxyribonuclease VII small subunit [Acidimicrobiales bacterium]MEE1522587.1 exodeoxyribonuclease VII small subunit [Acidimicrobiales bacterium]|tara:strand:- start:114 stop:326 length:213 start_codon:yes stop_codon:yes gene_type:complete